MRTTIHNNKSLLLLLLLLYTPLFCHASLFGLFSNPTISQDVVWLNINSSSINHVNVNLPAIMYDDNVQAATNLTQPSRHGLRGILYNRNDLCNQTTATTPTTLFFSPEYHRTLPRIALITSGGPCTFVDKIRLAQQEGAIGAIIYDQSGVDKSNSSNYVDGGTMYVPTDTDITIPAFHVDPRIGSQLSRYVSTFAQQGSTTNNTTVQQAVRVLMLPGSTRGPNPWELTLIVMSALLAIGFLTSVIMHCHLLRKNKRLRERVEQGLVPPPPEMLPMGKQLLDESQLNNLPTRTIGGHHVIPNGHAIRRRASRVSIILSKKNTTIAAEQLNNKKQEDNEDEEMCAICLEKVDHGDMVRQLPCHHEFHCECIDPWLTSKAAECPLCKHDCSQPFIPRIQSTILEEDQNHNNNNNNNINNNDNTSSKRFTIKMKKLFPKFIQREQRHPTNDPERQRQQQQQQQSYTEHIELSSTITQNR